MVKVFVDKNGELDEYEEKNRRKHIRFPVCLAVRYHDQDPEACQDFVLNISKSGVFIRTDRPYSKGARITMHFYIPPEEKLLGEFEGEVVYVNNGNPARGIQVKFVDCSKESLQRLEEYLEEKRHLIDSLA